jgi:hypothetical protein
VHSTHYDVSIGRFAVFPRLAPTSWPVGIRFHCFVSLSVIDCLTERSRIQSIAHHAYTRREASAIGQRNTEKDPEPQQATDRAEAKRREMPMWTLIKRKKNGKRRENGGELNWRSKGRTPAALVPRFFWPLLGLLTLAFVRFLILVRFVSRSHAIVWPALASRTTQYLRDGKLRFYCTQLSCIASKEREPTTNG